MASCESRSENDDVCNIGRAGVRAIDLALQRHYRLFLFSDDPACILRVAPTVSAHAVTLRDGTRVARGEPILEMHLWNERLPALPRGGATLAWGVDFARRTRHSLRLLADYLAREPRFSHLCALHAELGFLELDQFPEMGALVERLGFECGVGDAPGWRAWKYTFWQNVFSWWLMWAFNPASLEGKYFAKMARGELWLSRATLMQKYQLPAVAFIPWSRRAKSEDAWLMSHGPGLPVTGHFFAEER